MKKIIVVTLMLIMFGAMGGCTNIQDDTTRTQTEGTLVGLGGGAIIGAVIGGIIGGGDGALIGVGIGATVGGLTGYIVGSNIAEEKAKYASEEQWLDACLMEIERTNAELLAYNDKLTAEIAALDAETKSMQTAYRARQADQAAMQAKQEDILASIENNKQLIAAAEHEIEMQQKVLADARQNNQIENAEFLNAEIKALQAQKARLEESNKQLANMVIRVSI